MILIPSTGSVATASGRMAQWMAQSTDVVTPRASQLILENMRAKITTLQLCCKYFSKPEQCQLSAIMKVLTLYHHEKQETRLFAGVLYPPVRRFLFCPWRDHPRVWRADPARTEQCTRLLLR